MEMSYFSEWREYDLSISTTPEEGIGILEGRKWKQPKAGGGGHPVTLSFPPKIPRSSRFPYERTGEDDHEQDGDAWWDDANSGVL